MTTLDDLFPSRWIAADDLLGDKKVVTINRHSMEDVARGEEKKSVLWFKEYEKGMVLNKTNGKAIAKIYGKQIEDWIGKTITIFPTYVDFKGESVIAIRVEPVMPVAPEHDDAPPSLDEEQQQQVKDDVPF